MMKIFAIGDLHLSFNEQKPMDVFGEHWLNHYKRIKNDWIQRVTDEDVVLIAGDTSWAMNIEDALVDLEWIDALPGTKYLIKGNHDYWWKSVTKLNEQFKTLHFIQNNSFEIGDYAICGTRGWMLESSELSEQDQKIFNREIMRLERSVRDAVKMNKKIIAVMHYPPMMKNQVDSGFSEILEKYGVSVVVFGHLHDSYSWNQAITGEHRGVEYHLVSCDYLDFHLKEIV